MRGIGFGGDGVELAACFAEIDAGILVIAGNTGLPRSRSAKNGSCSLAGQLARFNNLIPRTAFTMRASSAAWWVMSSGSCGHSLPCLQGRVGEGMASTPESALRLAPQPSPAARR